MDTYAVCRSDFSTRVPGGPCTTVISSHLLRLEAVPVPELKALEQYQEAGGGFRLKIWYYGMVSYNIHDIYSTIE